MLSQRSVLITAGPTWEAIDPVRGITNHSSGKMGYALAHSAAQLGAKVYLISGPVCLDSPDGVFTTKIESALQMYQSVHQHIQKFKIDIFISVAAVADYRPAESAKQKIKKSNDELTLKLIKNPDIVASVAKLDINRPYTVGFAAETQHLERHTRDKLIAKNLDMIVGNDVNQQDTGFGSDLNEVIIMTKNQTFTLAKQNKSQLADTIITAISNNIKENIS